MSCTQLADPMGYAPHWMAGKVMLMGMGTNYLRLLHLPDEILLAVVHHLDVKRDLLNLSLTCRKLEDVAAQKLYRKVDIRVWLPRSLHLSQEMRASRYRQHVFNYMQELTISNSTNDCLEHISLRNKMVDCSFDDFVCGVLQKMPEHQLRSFKLLNQTTLTPKILETLATKHKHCLEELRFFETQLEHRDAVLPNKLRRIQCRSVQSGGALADLIEANKETLEFLHIGQEKELVENYRRDRQGFFGRLAHPLQVHRPILDFAILPKLRQLRMVGLNLETVIPHNVQLTTFLWRLEALAIESCGGATHFLDALSRSLHHIGLSNPIAQEKITPALKTFTFRHEALSGHIKDALIHFLTSFAGLTELALLFENATLVERPAIFIADHGKTLQKLVMETRIQPREHLGMDTSRPLGIGGYSHQLWQDSVNDICELCPNLVELGMGFPWDDEMIRLKKTKLSMLKKLKTVHVRNFPQSQVLSQIGDYAIQEHARKFVEWCFPSLVGSGRPGLETLAIGPTLYESRWKCSSTPSTPSRSSGNYQRCFSPPEYLRSHYFCLDWAKTRFGRWHAMITPVTENYMEDLRHETPLEGIFQHVWLR